MEVLYQFLPVMLENLLVSYRSDPLRPTTVMVETTNHCDLSCTMCATRLAHRTKGFMSLDTFDRVIGEVTALGARNIALHSVGETRDRTETARPK